MSEQRDQGEHQQGDEQEHRGSDTREVGVRVAEVQLRSLDTTQPLRQLFPLFSRLDHCIAFYGLFLV